MIRHSLHSYDFGIGQTSVNIKLKTGAVLLVAVSRHTCLHHEESRLVDLPCKGCGELLVKYLGFLLYANIILLTCVYVYLFKRRTRIGFQLGMNVATMAGGFAAVVTGVILIYQFPFHYVVITIVSTIVGMFVGALFGALVDYQTLLTGYANGLMMGIMAPMIGAAAKNSVPFLIFIEILFIISLFLFISSSKHT